MPGEQGDTTSPRGKAVYGELYRAINALELAPGTMLVESKLAESLGVSRTPIRQALQQLELEGLVEHGPGRSYTVRGLTLQNVHEICDLLEVLDRYVVSAAMKTLTNVECQKLLELTREMKKAASEGDTNGWGAADKEFHRLLQDAASNHLVKKLQASYRARIHKFWASSVSQDRLQRCSAEHEQIALAIRDGDESQAMSLVSEHVQHMARASIKFSIWQRLSCRGTAVVGRSGQPRRRTTINEWIAAEIDRLLRGRHYGEEGR